PKPNSKKSLVKVENWQQNVGNAHRRFIAIVDPHLGEDRYTAKTVEENAATMENLDKEREATGMARLAEFMTVPHHVVLPPASRHSQRARAQGG
ncbi:hypothetical protein, partial [Clavibacter michiganensis]|uniref:hypothetical protein n=1 Tax=Clavibacter michiganensis TaxID=28447 RepID=UPI00292EB3EF